MIVTDGEPTAHLEDFGDGAEPFFYYPPHPRTIALTVKGFDELAALGAQLTIFRLGSDPGLARFIDQVARRVGGRVVVPDLDGLGAASGRGLSAGPAPLTGLHACACDSSKENASSAVLAFFALDADAAPQREAADGDARSAGCCPARRRDRTSPSRRGRGRRR